MIKTIEKNGRRNTGKASDLERHVWDFQNLNITFLESVFPYPSGWVCIQDIQEGYTATDITARNEEGCRGMAVLILWGMILGLPTEQYAVNTGHHHPKRFYPDQHRDILKAVKRTGIWLLVKDGL